MYVCPRCKGSLTTISSEGLDVEKCAGCGGTWLDANELKMLAERSASAVATPKSSPSQLPGNSGPAPGAQSSSDMSCPKCANVSLRAFIYGCDSGIELDRCPQCSGLWFDSDELDQIMNLMAKEDNSQLSDIIKTRKDSEGLLDRYSGEIKSIGKYLMRHSVFRHLWKD